MARLGATTVAHPAPALVAVANRVDEPVPAVGAPDLAVAPLPRSCPPLAVEARGDGSDPLATAGMHADVALGVPDARRVDGLISTGARAPRLLSARHRRASSLARPGVHPGPAGGGRRLRTMRRERVPWTSLSRERLAAAWGRVQIEHASLGELLLVGVFGPVPIDAVTSVALDPDGRLAMTFSRAVSGRRGDIALARHAASGRLVRSDVPRPPTA